MWSGWEVQDVVCFPLQEEERTSAQTCWRSSNSSPRGQESFQKTLPSYPTTVILQDWWSTTTETTVKLVTQNGYFTYVTFLFSSRGMSGSLSLLLSWIGNLNLHLKRSLLNYFLISHFKVGSLYSVRCVDEYKINTKFLLWIALTWHLCVYWGVLLFSLKEAAQVQVEECKIIMQHVVACCLLVKVD